ncbi:DNA-binding protein [Streptomyces sp. NPDC056486]|uniref:DNA-binding protein n=1 Tax=Streptomyces sp. NPDC056486 TaxID=3345835 RepID=UPI0036911040
MTSTPEQQPDETDPFSPTHPDQVRAGRAPAALFRIAERHATTLEQRRRQVHATIVNPHEAVRLVTFLMTGIADLAEDEPEVDHADITAALTLVPMARSEMDDVEAALLKMARGRGMTWPDIAFGLGLGTPQAARQRYERLIGRTTIDPETTPVAPEATPPDL